MTQSTATSERSSGTAGHGASRLRSLGPTVMSRTVDQAALGIVSLVIARRVDAADFAPFAGLLIAYSLAVQLADGGLAFVVLRTPAGNRLDQQALRIRRVANAVLATIAVIAGFVIGGTVGQWLALAAAIWLLGAETYIRRASLQQQGQPVRLATAEASGAVVFAVIALATVFESGHLAIFGAALVAKLAVELVLQGGLGTSFAPGGLPAIAGDEWRGQAVTYATANADYAAISLLLGAEALSTYTVSYRVAAALFAMIGAPLTRAAFVDFASSTDPQKTHDHLMSRIAIGGLVAMAATMVAGPLLPIFLGSGWEATSGITILLAVAVPWRLMLGSVVALGITLVSARAVIRWEIRRLIITGIGLAIGVSFGLIETTAAVSATAIIGIRWAHREAATGAGLRVSPWLDRMTWVTAIGVTIAGFVIGQG